MTHIPDLAPNSYSQLKGPLRAVGWLDAPHAYTRGAVEAEFVRRLGELIEHETPTWIGHYVLQHSYRPPDEFQRAVLSCPEPGSQELPDALAVYFPLHRFTCRRDDPATFFVDWKQGARRTLQRDPEYGSMEAIKRGSRHGSGSGRQRRLPHRRASHCVRGVREGPSH